MEKVLSGDRDILRELAMRKSEFSHSERNKDILEMWNLQARGVRDKPTVRLLFSNFTNEVLTPRLRCEGNDARRLEWRLLSSMVGRELFDDDTPVSDTLDVNLFAGVSPFGTKPKAVRKENSMGYHIEPVTDDIERDFNLFCGGSFYVDYDGTKEYCAWADDIIGDILPSRIVQNSHVGAITNNLVRLINMETYYMSMYDAPETLHKIMNTATSVYEKYFDYIENNGFLFPTNGYSGVAQESFAFTDELPMSGEITSIGQQWGFLESQETTAVSPDMYGEFVYPYYDRLVKRFGLLSYGCCERVDNILEDYLLKWKNLRKLSVSPFNDERKIGEYLRGTRIVYYSKPRAEYVTNPGPLDKDALDKYFKGVFESASGCLLEIAQREVGTIFGDFDRGREYVRIAKECLQKYWKP